MRILQVVSTPPFAWATGGCAKAVFEISKALARRGHDVSILTTDMFEPGRRYKYKQNPEIVEGVKIHRCKYVSDWLAWKHKVYISPGLAMKFKDLLSKTDIVHIQDLLSLQALWASQICTGNGRKYVLSGHGSAVRLMPEDSLGHLYYSLIGRRVVYNAVRVIALTEHESGQFEQLGIPRKRIAIVPNGVDLDEFRNLPNKGVFRSKHQIQDNMKIVLYLGRIHRIKGLDLLVQAHRRLLRTHPDCLLVIVGPDDGYEPELRKAVAISENSDKVVFTGPLYGREKLEAYVDSDVFVLPSRYEAFPMTVLEAWSCGLPVITTRNCSICNLVERAGYVVDFSVGDLEMALNKILFDTILSRHLGDAGRKIVVDEFDVSNSAAALEVIYEEASSSGDGEAGV